MNTFRSWDGDRHYVGEYPTDRPGLASERQLLMEKVADRESRLRHAARINEMMRPYAIQARLGDFYMARKIQRCWWKYILRKGFRPFRAAMLEEARELLSWEERTKDGFSHVNSESGSKPLAFGIEFARRESRKHSVPGRGGVPHARK